MNSSDVIVQEVRKIRENLAAKHGYDLTKIISDARHRSKEKVKAAKPTLKKV
ncbi:MAG: hypothetical protein HC845_03445 [Akkermansiaceae bacterium]|nr:hypothetical protein [Akkermansiaceae bacterium]